VFDADVFFLQPVREATKVNSSQNDGENNEGYFLLGHGGGLFSVTMTLLTARFGENTPDSCSL
jgi:hypothetical protein